jgi:hypothetical protein
MRLLLRILVVGLIGLSFGARAAEAKDEVTGRWNWSRILGSGEIAVWTLDLKQDGERLSGTMTFSGGLVLPPEEGKVVNGQVTFKATQIVKRGKLGATYTGKIKGGSLELRVEPHDNGNKLPVHTVVAKRVVVGEKSKKSQ